MRIFIFLSLTVLLALATTKTAFSENRYWVNGSGNWNDPQQWSETSGGVPGATVPTKEDHVIFDNNSFTSNNQTVIIKEVVYCNDFRWEVDNYQPTLKSAGFIFKKWTKAAIQVHGSLIINENVNHAFFGDIVLKSSGESSIDINSKLTADVIIDATNGEYGLINDFETVGDIYLKSGAFNLNNNRIKVNEFIGSGNRNRTLNIDNSEIYINKWDFEDTENLSYEDNNAIIRINKRLNPSNFKAGKLDYGLILKSDSKASFNLDSVIIDSVLCYGESDGQITAYVSGGSPDYDYQLRDGGLFGPIIKQETISSTNYTFTGLEAYADYYTVVIENGGSADGQFTPVEEPDPLSADSISVITPLSCFDGSDAELEAFASGGTEPYSYHWVKYNTSNGTWESIGQTTKIATNISQGIYRVYIDDNNSCGLEYVNKYFTNPPDDENIPEEIVFDNISKTNSCEGADNGTITLEASGGTGDIDYYLIRLSDMLNIPAGPPYDEDGYFTGLQPDTYETYAIDDNGCTKQGADVGINETTNPTADAGSGGDECDLNFVLNATPSVGVGTWTSSGPGNASFAPNANDSNATVTVDAYGSYDFTWTENNDGCIDQDQVTVNFYENPTANAGSGGDECDFDFVLNATPSVGTGTWTYSGPGNASFVPDANDPNATVTVDAYGTYTFTWTEVNGTCTDDDDVVVNFYEQPIADAGAGGSVCGLDFGLSATPSVGTGTWTYSGPGNASFAPD
ncbi:MAG: SprB repeat-containing protein, partial [Bacteroidota bacterium]|nr:SprB repeat-containing protein [Bacteroidota bacterium]